MPEVPQGEQLEYLPEGPGAAAGRASLVSPIHSDPAQEERDLQPQNCDAGSVELRQEDETSSSPHLYGTPEIPAPIEDCPSHYSTPVQNPGAPASV